MLAHFQNMQIRSKLLTTTGLFVFMTVALSCMFFQAFSTAKVNGAMYAEIVQGKDLLADILPPPAYIIETYLNAHLALAEKDPARQAQIIGKVAALHRDFTARLTYWQDALPAGDMKQCLVNEVAPPAVAFYQELDKSVWPLVRARQPAEARARFDRELQPLYDAHRKAVDKLGEIAAQKSAQREAAAAQYVAAWSWRISTLSIIGTLAIAALTGIVAWSISRQLRRAARTMQDIAAGEGDLTQRLDADRHDEIGDLGRYFNQFVEKIQGTIGRITGNSKDLTDTAVVFAVTGTQLAQNAEVATAQSTQVAAAAEQLNTTMSSMAASAQEMSANATVAASAVEQLTTSISEIAKSAEQAACVATQASQGVAASNTHIAELGSAAQEIGKILEVIQEIADQTNLLALNATIEAARAGDAGKGFAVVATEVKELAKQTGSATDDIRRRVEEIQSSTSRAVQSVSEISHIVDQVNDLSRTIASAVEEQSITTKEIAENVHQSALAAKTVAHGVAESATATHEITRNITAIDQAMKETAQGATNTQRAGSDTWGVIESLTTQLGQFQHNRSTGFDARAVRKAHADWITRLTGVLSGSVQLRADQVSDHTSCQFGKWYYGEGQRLYGQLPEFKAIEGPHGKVHQAARTIVQLYNQGEKLEAVRVLGELAPVVRQLLGMLDRLELATREPAAAV